MFLMKGMTLHCETCLEYVRLKARRIYDNNQSCPGREKVKTLETALDNALDNGVLSSHSRSTVDTQLIQKDIKMRGKQ